jgi:hypothetical protein
MLSIHLRLGLPSGLFPSGFPTNNLYTFLFSPIRATCPAHLILLDVHLRRVAFCHSVLHDGDSSRSTSLPSTVYTGLNSDIRQK